MSHTREQREAIESWGRGHVCVVAGPGSGKTRVLVERIRSLVCQKDVPPEEILAITFTRKAAHNMYRRLVEQEAADSPWRRTFERVVIATIDAFCSGVLGEHAIEAQVDPDYRILEPASASVELRRAVDETLTQVWREDPAAAHRFLLRLRDAAGWADEPDSSKIHEQFLRLVEAIRGAGGQAFAKPVPEDPFPEETRWAARAAERILAAYEAAKRGEGVLDFADLASRLTGWFAAGGRPRQTYRHILIDENQDTNPVQARLVQLLEELSARTPAVIFAVGDVNQSIYGFRHANPEVFRQFRESVRAGGGHEVELRENFRSRAEILAAVHALTGKRQGVEPHRLTARRNFRESEEPSVEVLIARGASGDEAKAREAAWTARRIRELRGALVLEAGPARWKHFAILSRTNGMLDEFAAALRAAGIPYQTSVGRSFFQSHEVRDLLAYLRALDNPRDEISLAAALRSPLGGLSDAALLRLKADGRNLAEAQRRPPDLPAVEQDRLARFTGLFDYFRRTKEDAPLDLLIHRILARTGYEAWLLEQEGGLQRAANARKLAELAGRASAGLGGSFAEAVRRLEQYKTASAGEGEASVPEDAADAVHLLTVHAAKGLEFPVVFVPCLQSPAKGSVDSLLYSEESGVTVRWADSEAGEEVAGEAYKRIAAARKDAAAKEEDRIFYVALTRAEERLILSASWGERIRRAGWSKSLDKEGLQIDLTVIDGQPIEQRRDGFRFRLFRTETDPPPLAAEEFAADRQPVVRLVPLDEGGQADSEVSVTAVALFASCPRRYFLSRYLGLEEAAPAAGGERTAGASAVSLGRQTHELLAGSLAPEEASAEAVELARKFEQHSLAARAGAARVLERERTVLFEAGGGLLRGQIDLYFEDAQGAVLVDYKTDRVSAQDAPAQARTYAVQMQLYALALAREGRRPGQGLLFYLRPGVVVETDLRDEALDAAAARAKALFDAQQRMEFPPAPGPHCERCPHYKGACPAHVPGAGAGRQMGLPFA